MSVVAYDLDRNGRIIQLTRRPTIAPPKRVPQPSLPFAAPPPHRAPLPAPLAPPPRPSDLTLDRRRDALLTPFGKATLEDRYLMPGESFQDMFARVAVRLCRRYRPRAAAL